MERLHGSKSLFSQYLTYCIGNWKFTKCFRGQTLQKKKKKNSYILVRNLVLCGKYWHWLIIGKVNGSSSLSIWKIYFHLNGTKINLCRLYIIHLNENDAKLIPASFKEFIKR